MTFKIFDYFWRLYNVICIVYIYILKYITHIMLNNKTIKLSFI